MTFGRPWALGLLAAVALLLWLRRRAARPRAAEASSLLVWRRIVPAERPPVRPRPPLAAWLEAMGALALVLGMADPVATGAGTVPVRIVIDDSPSMQVRVGDVGTRGRVGAERVASEAARLGIDVVRQQADVAALRVPAAESPVLFLTDRRDPSLPERAPGLRVVGLGGPLRNAGITALRGKPGDAGGWVLAVEVGVHGIEGPAELRLRAGEREESWTVGGPGHHHRQVVVDRRESFTVIVTMEDDELPDDDVVTVTPVGRATVSLAMGGEATRGPSFPDGLRRVFAAVEAKVPDRPLVTGVLEIRGPAATIRWRLIDGSPGAPTRGAEVVAADDPLVADVRIDPELVLGPRLPGTPPGTVLLADPAGPLLTAERADGTVTLHSGFVPGADWLASDPAVVVLVQNLVEAAGGGPARLAVAGVLDRVETDGEGETFGEVATALRELAAEAPGAQLPLAGALFALAAALLLASALLPAVRR